MATQTGPVADADAEVTGTATAVDTDVGTDWYKDAVIYELHVRGYADGNGDGVGDFPGLLARLDHLQQLGIDTVWLLPFFASPLRDDGYDVADHTAVHPSYGTIDDFRAVVEQAHRRGMRVMVELVLNHTSDLHPWFQRARQAPRGSVHRDFYVWRDDDRGYAGTRVIFHDAERSNWAWDPVAGQFYWHRFFAHQPDLNFDNPAVIDAIAEVMHFWRELGVDGFRLDAVPYLVEREGSRNENLPETHEVIRELRRRMDRHRPGGVLLAEANLWPEDVRDYFGDGDECHMAYHFPLMPRMYMAIAQEERHPVTEILAQTPTLPPEGQWAIFLRNHDELTLESVTSSERDYMVRMYAADTRARLNLGIRRRLAPLLDNDRPRIELMNALLLSLPGTPVLYYGDEIGMGDNLYLGDRHGVRTPMQWSRDRNGGFSSADPQALYLPAIQDPVYGYEAVNVEAQWREPSSLLNWMRRALGVRAATPALRRGRYRALAPGNRKILAWLRETEDETVLCVANLARAAQAVELDLQPWRGRVPVELFGRHAFPPVGDLPYLLTLPGHGFYWFRLCTRTDPPAWHVERLPVPDLPMLVLFDGWRTLFPTQVPAWRLAMAQHTREQFETEVLTGHLRRAGWYQGADPVRVELVDHATVVEGTSAWMLALGRVRGSDAAPSPSVTPLAPAEPAAQPVLLSLSLTLNEDPDPRTDALLPAALARVRQRSATGVMADATADEAFCRALVRAVGAGLEVATEGGATLVFEPGPRYRELVGAAGDAHWTLAPLPAGRHTLVVCDGRLLLKVYRLPTPGPHPELEMGRHLGDVLRQPNCLPVAGSLHWRGSDGTSRLLALLQPSRPQQGHARDLVVEQLAAAFDRARAGTQTLAESLEGLASRMRVLAQRTAELHTALAKPTGNPAFDPQPVHAEDVGRWVDQLCAGLTPTDPLQALAESARQVPAQGARLRIHGRLRLLHVQVVQDDFLFVDFEGDPSEPVEARRALHTPLRDLGTLMGSVVEAVDLAAARCVDGPPAQARALAADELCQAVLQAYAQTAVAGGLWPDAAAFEADAPLRRLFEHAALPASWRQDAGSRTDADPNADPNADTDADPDGGALDRTGMRPGDTSASAPRTDSRTHP